MSFIPQITCRQCGTKFSAIHGRCPNCGAPRVNQSARPAAAAPAEGTAGAVGQAGNLAKWQMIFGGILIVAVIVAVIILITASLNPANQEETVEPPPTIDVNTPPPTTPLPTDTPTPTVPVASVTIVTKYNGSQVPDSFTQRITWAPIDLDAVVYPTEALNDAKVEWHSSDDAVCTVDENGVVTAVGAGSCEIIAECGGVAASCWVLVP